MPEDRIALADEIERCIAAIDRSRCGLGVDGSTLTRLALVVYEFRSAILAALRQDAEAVMRERAAKLCEARADYFDASSGHRDWKDAARSYRATASEIRALPLSVSEERSGNGPAKGAQTPRPSRSPGLCRNTHREGDRYARTEGAQQPT